MTKRKWVAVTIMSIMVLLPAVSMAEPVTVNWWHSMGSAWGEATSHIINKFNDSQNKYRVVGTFKGDYYETLNEGVTAFRTGKQPHILQVFEMGTQTMMLSGAIYPVHQLMKDTRNDIDWSGFIQPVLSYYMNADGNLMSMPFNASTPVMFYNRDLFKKAGITAPPATWDEMGETTAKLVAAGVEIGMVTAWQCWTQIENYCAIQNIPFATKFNGYEGLDTKLAINDPRVVNHINRLKEWSQDRRFVYTGRKYQGAKSRFIAQKAGIYMDSTGLITELQKDVTDFQWGVAPLPHEASVKSPQNSIIGGASLWVLQGHAREEYEGAAAFLKFLASDRMQQYWHRKTGYIPITAGAYKSLRNESYYRKNPRQEVGIRQLKRRLPTKLSRGIRLGYFAHIRKIINEELELVWNGGKTAKRALDSAVRRGNTRLKAFARLFKKRNRVFQNSGYN